MGLNETKAADFAKLLAEDGKAVVLAGQSKTCMISEPSMDVALEIGGLDVSQRLNAKFLRSDLADRMPQIGDTFLYAGTTFHVRAVINRPPNPIITLEVHA